MEQQRGQFETEQEHIAAVRAGGMRMLHTELSAEARAIIDEIDAQGLTAEAKGDRLDANRCVLVATKLSTAFKRLGLDLTKPEESE